VSEATPQHPPLPHVVIHTDGACSGNPGPGGWGAILAFGDHEKEISGGEADTTNNRMELMAAIAALEGSQQPVEEMVEEFRRRRDIIVAGLNDIPGISCLEPQGAFYCYPSVKALLGLQIAGRRPRTSAELAELILDEAEVALVPGEAFGTPGYFRLSCALGDADLEEGIARMAKLLAGAR